MSLAEWRCHKVVKAGKIHGFPAPGKFDVEQTDGTKLTMDIPADLFARGRASPGDYLVVYDDDYQSWSPRKAFEEGYHLL